MKKIFHYPLGVLLLCLLQFKTYSQQSIIDSLLVNLKTSKEDTNKVIILIKLCTNYWYINPDESLKYGEEALELSKKLHWNLGIGRAYGSLGNTYTYKSEYLRAQEYNFKSLKIFEDMDYKTGMAVALHGIANIYKNQSEYSKALEFAFKALKLNQALDNKKYIGLNLVVIADIYSMQSNYPKSLEYNFKALKLNEEIGNMDAVAGGNSIIAQVYSNQSDYSKSLEYHFRALKLYEELENKNGIASTLNNIGDTYVKMPDYYKAQEYFEKSAAIFDDMGDKSGFATVQGNIGEIYKNQSNYPKSIEYYFKAVKTFDELGDIDSKAIFLVGISEVYLKTARNNNKEAPGKIFGGSKNAALVQAKNYADSAILIFKKTGNLNELKEAYKIVSETEAMMGDYKSSLKNYMDYVATRDSVYNEENTKKSVQSRMQYEFDKKEAATKAEQDKKDALSKAEIKRQTLIRNSTFGGVGIVGIFAFFLVRSTNRRKKTSFEKQVSQVEMKALRSQMNPHFIFNSLNSIHSFIQQNKGEKASDYLIKFSRLMRLILENSNHEEVSVESDLEALGLYMELEAARMNNKFTFSIDVDEDIDIENTLVPPLILQPFVENSIWHGMMHKSENGFIKINISKNGDMVKCTVEDNGVGREKAKELKSTTQKGKHESLGMKITNERIAIINRIKKSKAFVALKDLHDDAKKPLGTLVEVQLPFETGF